MASNPSLASAKDIGPQDGFAPLFKDRRLKKGLKQQQLADTLHVKLRTIVSWEIGERTPPAAAVLLLCEILGSEQDNPADLLRAYLLDELKRENRRHTSPDLHDLIAQASSRLALFPIDREEVGARPEEPLFFPFTGAATRSEEQTLSLQPREETGDGTFRLLFAIIDQLRAQPELISVVSDFLREIAPNPQGVE